MLLWIDLETTGLDPRVDAIIEVAWLLTDNSAASITDITSRLVEPSPRARSRMLATPEVISMHVRSGLIEDLSSETGIHQIEDVEDEILASIKGALAKDADQLLMVAGFSVHFDLAFIQEYMPRLAEWLSHRVYDVSTLKTFFSSAGLYASVENLRKHRAEADVIEALEVARTYRDILKYAVAYPVMEPTHA